MTIGSMRGFGDFDTSWLVGPLKEAGGKAAASAATSIASSVVSAVTGRKGGSAPPPPPPRPSEFPIWPVIGIGSAILLGGALLMRRR